MFTNAYSAGNGTSDNMLQENWYNSGGAQMPNAAAHNNQLIDNVQVSGNNWPSAAWEVICAAGVAPEYRTELNANLGGIDPRCETVAATETPVAQLPALPARRPRDVSGAGAPCRRRSLDDQGTRGNVWHLQTGTDDDFDDDHERRVTTIGAIARLTYPSSQIRTSLP